MKKLKSHLKGARTQTLQCQNLRHIGFYRIRSEYLEISIPNHRNIDGKLQELVFFSEFL